MNQDLYEDHEAMNAVIQNSIGDQSSEMPSELCIKFNRRIEPPLTKLKTQTFTGAKLNLHSTPNLMNRRINAKQMQQYIAPSNKVLKFTQLKLSSTKNNNKSRLLSGMAQSPLKEPISLNSNKNVNSTHS